MPGETVAQECTLWADGRLAGDDATPPRETGGHIKDLRHVAKRLIANADEVALHARTRGVVEAAMGRPRNGRLMIVMHHAPHPVWLPAANRTGWAASHSASDLLQVTDTGQAALWDHGHIHSTLEFTRPGRTRIMCNARRARVYQQGVQGWLGH